MLLESFARFFNGVFPSITPELREALRADIRQHGDISADFFASPPNDRLMQGDIVGPLPFLLETADGELVQKAVPGMLLSQSCDFDEDVHVLFAPAYPYADVAHTKNASSIRANEMTPLFYLPPLLRREALVVDFRLMQPLRKASILTKYEKGAYRRTSSFTDEGWYLLLAKLTLHFLRPQASDEDRGVSRPLFAERVEYVVGQIPALGRYLIHGRS